MPTGIYERTEEIKMRIRQGIRARGYRHTQETKEKIRKKLFKGESVKKKTGNHRAYFQFQLPSRCELCDNPAHDRHHKDGNTLNNDPSNIQFLCVKCHMALDGRMNPPRDWHGRIMPRKS